MEQILVDVRNKVATPEKNALYICGNSDFTILFSFDEEWNQYDYKTAVFHVGEKTMYRVFHGNICTVPVITNTYNFEIGVTAGELSTTTSAYIPCKKSVLCEVGLPEPPEPDVYAQIMNEMNRWPNEIPKWIEEDLTAAKESGMFTPVKGVDYWTPEDQAAIDNAVQGEQERDEAEADRQDAEAARQKDETARKNAENARVAAEKSREANEQERITAEDKRNTAETNRNTAEQSRADSETARVTAETNRVNAEKTRASAESSRVKAETTRIGAENNRATAEKARATAETARENAESSRVNAEKRRETAEAARVTAEAARVKAEDSRVAAENKRVTAEQARAEAETGRVESEESRVEAETQREETFATVADTAIKAAEAANIAATSAAPAIQCNASGGVVSVADASERPAVSLISHIASVQSGSGDPSPDNVRPITGWDTVSITRTGKNLFAVENGKRGVITIVNDTVTIDGTVANTTTWVFPMKYALPSGVYSIRQDAAADLTNISIQAWEKPVTGQGGGFGNILSAASVDGINSNKKIEYTTRGIGFRIVSGTYSNITFRLQIEKGPVATDFEPYNGQTLETELPETIYGGSLDWTTGVITVDKLSLTYNGTEGWQMVTSSNGLTVFRVGSSTDRRMVAIKQDTTYTYPFVASHFIHVEYYASNKPDYSAYMFDGTAGRTLALVNSAWTTTDDCTAYLAAQAAAGTPLTCVFNHSTPYTIQLTPQQMDMLKGTNNVWNDTGDTTLVYVADTKMYIDNAIAAIAAATVKN